MTFPGGSSWGGAMDSLSKGSPVDERTKRFIGLDIFKILCVILISAIHFLDFSGLNSAFSNYSVNKILTLLIRSLTTVGVNGFILITGFFLVKSTFKLKKLFFIWGETLFFSLLLFILGCIFNLEEVRMAYYFFSVIPILSRHYWFATAYVILYLCSPFLNKLISVMTKKEYSTLLLGGAIIFSVWTTIIYFSEGALIGGGTGILWMIYLYLVGAYFNTHQVNEEVLLKFAWIISVLCLIGLVAYQILSEKLVFLSRFDIFGNNSLLPLLFSVSVFIIFKNINVKEGKASKYITGTAKCSFGVYLIQTHCMIYRWLWLDVVRGQLFFETWYLYPLFLLTVVVLFVLSFICEKIFKWIFSAIEKVVISIKNSKKAIQGEEN